MESHLGEARPQLAFSLDLTDVGLTSEIIDIKVSALLVLAVIPDDLRLGDPRLPSSHYNLAGHAATAGGKAYRSEQSCSRGPVAANRTRERTHGSRYRGARGMDVRAGAIIPRYSHTRGGLCTGGL